MKAIVIKDSPVHDAPGLHGTDIIYDGKKAFIWGGYGTKIDIDEKSQDDGWVKITGPAGFGPTWKGSGKQGWIEYAHLAPEGQGIAMQLVIDIDENGNATMTRTK